MTPEHMAEIVAQAIETAVAPLASRLAVAEAQLAAYGVAETTKTVGDLRERQAVQEAWIKPLMLKADDYATKQIVDGMAAALGSLRSEVAELQSKAAVPGPIGPVGPVGPMGPQGERGVDGRDGSDGKDGAAGAPGETGAIGPSGQAGPKGDPGERGADGVDGKDGMPGPSGEKGADGKDGKDGAPGPQGQKGMDGVAGPQGERGADGASGLNGKDGRDGTHGKDGAPGPQGEKGLDGTHGKDGAHGKDGKDGAPGPAGQKGLDGRDGIGMAGALIDRDGRLVLTLSDGTTKELGIVSGKDGAPGLNGKDADTAVILKSLSDEIQKWPRPANGKDGRDGLDGKDGLGFDDLSVAFDEAKGYRLVFSRGELTKEFAIPVVYYAGIWQSGRSYVQGASVTCKGSTWIAKTHTKAKPGEDETWRLGAKRGSQGEPGKVGTGGDQE